MPVRKSAAPLTSLAPPPSSFGASAITPLLVVCATAAVGWRLYRTCVLRVTPETLTVVYDARRRSVLTSNAAKGEVLPDTLRSTSFWANPLVSFLRFACRPRFRGVLFVPPLFGLYRVFSIPRSALNPSHGIRVRCVVEGVPVRDGVVTFVVSVCGFVDSRELDRYLALVGPIPAMEAMGRCASSVLRDAFDATLESNTSSTVTVGLLLDMSKWHASGTLMESFLTTLRARMVTDCCVVLKDVVMESVEMGSTIPLK